MTDLWRVTECLCGQDHDDLEEIHDDCDHYEERPVSNSEVLSAAVLNLPGVETVDWCEAHRSIAWEDFEERPFEEFVSRGYRCPSGAWIEGANAWDCHMIPVAIIALPEDPS